MMPERSDLPPGYRMTELGPLPEEWRVVRLGEVANIGHRGQKRIFEVQVPFIPMELIPQDGLYLDKWEKKAPQDVRSGVLVKNGDFLLAKITPSLENGKQGIVRNLPVGWGYATTEVYPIYPKDQQLLLEFLAYYLKVESVRQDLASKMEGTTGRQRLPKAVLREYPIPLPPLPEQRAIAHVLRTVQETKEATERVINVLRELKKSLMRHLFTYGPVPVDATDRVELQETEIGPIPKHWKVVRLEEVVDLIRNGLTYKQNQSKRGFPVTRIETIARGVIDPTRVGFVEEIKSELVEKYRLQNGDILFSHINSEEQIGKTAIYTGFPRVLLHGMNLLPIRAKRDKCNPYYLNYCFNFYKAKGIFIMLAARAVGQASINQGKLKSLHIPLPPLPEQQEIARMLQAVDARLEAEEKKKAALEALFQTLLHHLMTAKIRVKNFKL